MMGISLAAAGPKPAHANDRAQAEGLFAEGRAALKRGETALACEKFRKSNEIDSARGTRLNLALCEEELGKLATALRLFRSLSTAFDFNDERHALVAKHLQALESRVSRVRFRVGNQTPQALSVKEAGVEVATEAPTEPLLVDPGAHVFDVTATGVPPQRHVVRLREGELQVLDLGLVVPTPARSAVPSVPSPAPVTPSAKTSRSKSSFRTLGILTLGVGGGALAVGAITGLGAMGAERSMDAECDRDGCSTAGMEAARRGDTLATASTVAFVTGLALAGVGVTLIVLDADRRQDDSGAMRVSLTPGGLRLSARFSP
jgi:hypothetical protein